MNYEEQRALASASGWPEYTVSKTAPARVAVSRAAASTPRVQVAESILSSITAFTASLCNSDSVER